MSYIWGGKKRKTRITCTDVSRLCCTTVIAADKTLRGEAGPAQELHGFVVKP